MTNFNVGQTLKKTGDILASPWTIIVAIIVGIYLGVAQKELAQQTQIVGILYLNLFKMCVLPILTSGIIISLGRLMQRHDAADYIKKILVVFSLSLLGLSFVTIIVAMFFGPGKNLDSSALDALGVLVNNEGVDIELSLSGPLPVVKEATSPLVTFALNLVPSNIFESLSAGNTLQVLFFSIFFGIALGLVNQKNSDIAFTFLDSVYQSFTRVIDWLKSLLPFGLCSLIGAQIAEVGVETLLPMLKFIWIAILTFAIIYCLNTGVIWLRTGLKVGKLFRAMQETTFLAIATRSSWACLPSTIESMRGEMELEEQAVNLLLPLSITICRYGSVVYFGLSTIFVAQLYDTPIGIREIMLITVGVIMAGMATSGVTGILTLTMMSVVLTPLGLPLDAVLVLFIAIDPIMDPFRTLTHVHMGMAVTSIIAPKAGTTIQGDNLKMA